MSPNNVTPIRDPMSAAEPAKYFTVPGFDAVIVTYDRHLDWDSIEYAGTPEAVRSWRHTKDGMDCAPYLWFRITRGVRGRLDALPFGREAFRAHDAWCRWDEAEREADRRAQRRPPQLRLVIDNTRPA